MSKPDPSPVRGPSSRDEPSAWNWTSRPTCPSSEARTYRSLGPSHHPCVYLQGSSLPRPPPSSRAVQGRQTQTRPPPTPTRGHLTTAP